MAQQKTRKGYLDTEEGKDIKRKLQRMVDDTSYNTPSTFSPNTQLYPDNVMPFVDKHMNYLIKYPALKASMYLANLKLGTRIGKR